MKLVFAIVHDEDWPKLVDELNADGYMVTKLATTGGFLRSGNTTLIVGADKEKVPGVIEIIEKHSKSRKRFIPSSTLPNGTEGIYMPYPVEIKVGGATIFVLNVEQYEKI